MDNINKSINKYKIMGYSFTRTQREEANRISNAFYANHCRDCRCELEDEKELREGYCWECQSEYDNFENAMKKIQKIIPKSDYDNNEELIEKTIIKVAGCSFVSSCKLHNEITEQQINKVIEILKQLINQ